jgi:hypothetical protein
LIAATLGELSLTHDRADLDQTVADIVSSIFEGQDRARWAPPNWSPSCAAWHHTLVKRLDSIPRRRPQLSLTSAGGARTEQTTPAAPTLSSSGLWTL